MSRDERFNRLLSESAAAHLVVVCAGAGFGKSWAVKAYLEQSGHRQVWLALNRLDNIPSRFWEHFTAAVRAREPELAEKMKQLGFPETLQAFDNFLSIFTEILYRDQQFVVFVFDDLHQITEPLVLAFLRGLADARMENNCIILITRTWPADGFYPGSPAVVIGGDTLAFTMDETRELFDRQGFSFSADEITEIHHYVSGWPIALSIVASYLEHHRQTGRETLRFACTKPRLFELFEKEIFIQYTKKERELLIRLSALESFPRELVEAITGERHRDIQQLLADNQFIGYDVEARRFSFHPLYKEFLLEKLKSIDLAVVRETYKIAGDWCREAGLYYDAISYYRYCHYHEAIWETVKLFPAGRHSKSEADYLIDVIVQMPEVLRQQEPMSRIMLAMLLLNNLRFSESVQVITQVQAELEQAKPDHRNRELLGECYVARGLIILGMDEEGFGRYFRLAAEYLPDGSQRWGRKLRLIELGPGIHVHGWQKGALENGLAACEAAVPDIVKVLHGAGTGWYSLCESEALFLTGNLKAAIAPGFQALYEANAAEQYDIVGNALFILQRIYTAMGDYKSIVDLYEHIERYEKQEDACDSGIWDLIRGWFYTEMEQPLSVAGWIRNALQNGHPPISIARPLFLRLRCLIAEEKYAEALALLEQLQVFAHRKQAVIAMLYVELGRAVVHHALGNTPASALALTNAWELARENDFIMPFVEYGSRMRSLLERMESVEQMKIPREWRDQIRAKASTFAKRHGHLMVSHRQAVGEAPVDFGLSKREKELLNHLSQGLTREEICGCMELSLNTVKSMLKQIFAKLGAVNSFDAVRIAIINKII